MILRENLRKMLENNNQTWLESLRKEVDGVNLLDKLNVGFKTKGRNDYHIATLNTYLQKFYRVVLNRSCEVTKIEKKILRLTELRNSSSEEGESSSTEFNTRHTILLGLLDQFNAHLSSYRLVQSLFVKELEHEYYEDMVGYTVHGIRSGEILVGRDNNHRGDKDDLSMFAANIAKLLQTLRG